MTAEALMAKAASSTSRDPEHDIKLTEAVVTEHRLTGRLSCYALPRRC